MIDIRLATEMAPAIHHMKAYGYYYAIEIIDLLKAQEQDRYKNIQSPYRGRGSSFVRTTVAVFFTNALGASLKRTGKLLGDRDHSSIIHLLDNHENEYNVNPEYTLIYNETMDLIQQHWETILERVGEHIKESARVKDGHRGYVRKLIRLTEKTHPHTELC